MKTDDFILIQIALLKEGVDIDQVQDNVYTHVMREFVPMMRLDTAIKLMMEIYNKILNNHE